MIKRLCDKNQGFSSSYIFRFDKNDIEKPQFFVLFYGYELYKMTHFRIEQRFFNYRNKHYL